MNLGYILVGVLILIFVTLLVRFLWFLKKTGPSKVVNFGRVRWIPKPYVPRPAPSSEQRRPSRMRSTQTPSVRQQLDDSGYRFKGGMNLFDPLNPFCPLNPMHQVASDPTPVQHDTYPGHGGGFGGAGASSSYEPPASHESSSDSSDSGGGGD
jgi:hypothetical protein